MRHQRSAAAAALVVGLLVTGASPNGENGVTFLFPTGGETFLYPNTIVNVSYITPFPNPQMFIWCGSFGGDIRQVRIEFPPPFSGFHLTSINFTNSDKCWYNLRPNASGGYGGNSGGFYIRATDPGKPTTVGLATLVPTPSTTAVGAATTTSSAPTTATPVAAPGATSGSGSGTTASPNSTPLGSGAVAGIAAGATLLTAMLCFAAVAVWCAKKKKKRRSPSGRSPGSFWTAPSFLSRNRGAKGDASAETKPLAATTAPTVDPGGMWQASHSTVDVSSYHEHPSLENTPYLSGQGYYGAQQARSISALTVPTAMSYNASPSFTAAAVMPSNASGASHQTHLRQPSLDPVAGFATPEGPAAPVPAANTAAREAAELPSRHTYLSWGGEQEMPVSDTGSSRQMGPHFGGGAGADPAEQKFLLQDMQAFKTQRPEPRASGYGQGPYFAG